jgi:exodeoxyribonuclease VII small subunit
MTKEPRGRNQEQGDATLEARLRRLEEILARMESDDVALEEALQLFEEGVAHVRAAEQVLAAAELRVEELLGDGRTRPLETGGA